MTKTFRNVPFRRSDQPHLRRRSAWRQSLVDAERGLLFIKGAVPGADNSWVEVRDAVKSKLPADLPTPAAFKQPAAAAEGASA